MGSGPGGRISDGARQSAGQVRAAGSQAYDRDRMLPRLIGATEAEIADPSPAGRRRLLARLARALRGERARGRAGHWTYDLNRHIGLMQAYLAETANEKGGRREATATDRAGR